MPRSSALEPRVNQALPREPHRHCLDDPHQFTAPESNRQGDVLSSPAMTEQLARIEEKLDTLLSQAVPQDYYSVADVARSTSRAPFTVRQWCAQGRIRAEKRQCGRGLTREWMISHEELQRLRSEGLLPTERQSLRRA